MLVKTLFTEKKLSKIYYCSTKFTESKFIKKNMNLSIETNTEGNRLEDHRETPICKINPKFDRSLFCSFPGGDVQKNKTAKLHRSNGTNLRISPSKVSDFVPIKTSRDRPTYRK